MSCVNRSIGSTGLALSYASLLYLLMVGWHLSLSLFNEIRHQSSRITDSDLRDIRTLSDLIALQYSDSEDRGDDLTLSS